MNYEIKENKIIFSFEPRMNSNASLDVEVEIKEKLENHLNLSVVFDLDNVEYIASAFIRICISSAKAVGEGRFEIINTKPFIMKIFKIAGLDSILNVQ